MIHLDHSSISENTPVDFSESLRLLEAEIAGMRNDVLQPPAAMDAVEWIKKNIKLPKARTERPGDLELTGYQKEFIRLYFDENTTEIDVTKGARIGMSLALSALAAYLLAYLGENVTIAQPTDDDALAFYRERIEILFKICPALKALRRQPSRGESQDSWNEIHLKNGAILRLVGAVSDDSFRRYGSKNNFGDEYSAKGWAATKGSQGDKAALFMERGGEYSHPKMVLISTPLGKDDCRTTHRYSKSNQQLPWVTCPKCGHEQVQEWGDRDTPHGFKWNKDENGFVCEAWYQCANGCKITEDLKEDLDKSIRYKASQLWEIPGRVGMLIPQWLSFAGKASWKNLAQRFLSSRDNPDDMKTWVNNVKGVAYDDFSTSSMEANFIESILRPYEAEVPDDVVALVMGIDTQTNKAGNDLEELASREAQVVGYNRFGQFRVIGHWVIEGAPGDPDADAKMRDLINRKFAKRDGTLMPILATAIDLGGHFADETRAFCATFPARRNVWAIKGKNNSKGTRSTIWPRKASRSHKTGIKFYTIDSQSARDSVFRLLQMKGVQAPTVPISMPADFLEKLMCEERKRINGGMYWQPKQGRRAEEEWMCLAYSFVALKGLQTSYVAWRDLNLAARRAGIAELPPHDPETGEIVEEYSGADHSSMSLELGHMGNFSQEITSEKPHRHGAEQIQNKVPKAAPKPVLKRKKQGGRVVGSTARRW